MRENLVISQSEKHDHSKLKPANLLLPRASKPWASNLSNTPSFCFLLFLFLLLHYFCDFCCFWNWVWFKVSTMLYNANLKLIWSLESRNNNKLTFNPTWVIWIWKFCINWNSQWTLRLITIKDLKYTEWA